MLSKAREQSSILFLLMCNGRNTHSRLPERVIVLPAPSGHCRWGGYLGTTIPGHCSLSLGSHLMRIDMVIGAPALRMAHRDW